ncbi:MAG: hypothetical protein C4343_03135 [Chloroflexota bacterium]
MSKRHQHHRRRAYGPRQHEVRERRLRRHTEVLERWLESIAELRPENLDAGRSALRIGPWLAREAEELPFRSVD